MSQNQRKQPRRHLNYPVRIDASDSAVVHIGQLNDVSESGAGIQVPAPSKLPDSFVMALGFMGTVIRRCQVIWRSENRVGVKFIRRPAQPKTDAAASNGK